MRESAERSIEKIRKMSEIVPDRRERVRKRHLVDPLTSSDRKSDGKLEKKFGVGPTLRWPGRTRSRPGRRPEPSDPPYRKTASDERMVPNRASPGRSSHQEYDSGLGIKSLQKKVVDGFGGVGGRQNMVLVLRNIGSVDASTALGGSRPGHSRRGPMLPGKRAGKPHESHQCVGVKRLFYYERMV